MRYLFQNCENIKTIDLYKLERPTSGETTLFHTFCGCSDLSDLRIPEWGFEGCYSLDCAFFKCSSIETIDLSRIRGTVKNMCGAFGECSSLREIKGIGHVTNKWLYRIEYCFRNCSSLETLDLSGWTTERVIYYDHEENRPDNAITHCCRYETFSGCSRLRIITLGSEYTFANEKHGNDCYLPVPSPDSIDGADGKWYAASDGKAYAPRDMPTGKADTYYAVAPMSFAVYSSDDGSLNYYHRAGRPVKGDEWGGKKVDGVYSGFEDKRYRTTSATSNDVDTVTTPWNDVSQNVLTVSVVDDGIKPISIAYWFQFFRNCTSLDINNLDLSNCDSTQHCFAYCYSATDVKVDKLDVSNITEMDSTFKYMYSLESIDLSGWDTSKVNNMHEMFMNDYKIKKITFGAKWTTGKVNDFVEMFLACHELKLDCSAWDVSYTNYDIKPDQSHGDVITRGNSRFNSEAPGVILPDPWVPTAFAVYSEDDGGLNFYKQEKRLLPVVGGTYDGRSVSSVYTGFEEMKDDSAKWEAIRKDIKSVRVVDEGIAPKTTEVWFNHCTNLVSIDISKLDMSKVNSMAGMFNNCSALTSIDLSQVKAIDIEDMNNAFDCCLSMTSLDISGLTTTSETNMFCSFISCRKLTKITLGSGFVWGSGENIDSKIFDEPDGFNFPKWKADSDGTLYRLNELPSRKADTYYIINDMPDVPIPPKPKI